MTLNENHIRELLEQATPGPWTVKTDGWDETIIANDEGHRMGWGDQVRFKFEAGNSKYDSQVVALAPELATEVLRLHEALSAWIEDERAAETALKNTYDLGNTTTTHTTIINRINHILNGDTNE